MLLAMVLLALPAHAGDTAGAERLFQDGMALMESGDFVGACEMLEASMKADPSGGTALNLGRCNEEQGKVASAWASYEQAVTLFDTSAEGEREKFARERVAFLFKRLTRLTIEIDGDASVTVDGKPVEAASIGVGLPIDPGQHTIEAKAEGKQTWSKTVTIGELGDAVIVSITGFATSSVADTQTEPTEPESDVGGDGTGLMIAGGVVMGVGAVAGVIGGVLGGMVLSGASDAESDIALCPAQRCTPAGREEIDSLEGQALGANILIGVGAAALTAGAVMLIIGAMDDGDEQALLVPTVDPDGGGFVFRARF
jgi:hypothetical protein